MLKPFKKWLEKIAKRSPYVGVILTIVGAIVVALGFTSGLERYWEALQVCGALLTLGGITVAIYGAVAKAPMAFFQNMNKNAY